MYFNKNIAFTLLFLCFNLGISWSQTNVPPEIIATGNQAYCPLSEINIVTNFDIIDPDDTEIEALYIQISTGYVNGKDNLKLPNPSSHPNISTQWNTSEAKLTLTGSGGGVVTYADLIAAVKDVVFESSLSSVSKAKFFSFTIGDANYLPSTGHYYEYVSDLGITWSNAKLAAQSRTYFGLQGYLVTVTSQEEAQLTGEQAAGAGWIGASDAETEEVWKWVTGPESGTIFWNGLNNGSAPNGAFSFWNTSEPNSFGSGEDYVHITAPNVGILGAWNDLPNAGSTGDYEPKGYIVEYGGMPGDPILNLSASTEIYIPIINSIMEESSCGPNAITLSANSILGDVLWFDSATGGTVIHAGNTFTTPNISTTTTYYVLASGDGCLEGERTPVIATINEIPIIQPTLEFKNCDEDGNPDGFTDFNLQEANDIITLGDNNLNVFYYLSFNDADTDTNRINSSSFNNSTSNTVYGRVENTSGCYNIATVNLKVSTTSFPVGYVQELKSCDDDDIIDGLNSFDLTEASNSFIAQFPSGQNLTVQYYRNLTDAQLEQNEILPQNNYLSETPFSQTLYVRVESSDNGACFGIGPHLVLNVLSRPEFEVIPTAFVCLNLSPITLESFNPLDDYTYKWTDEGGNIIGTEATVAVSSGGTYTVVASSSTCESFPHTVVVTESIIATISLNDITIIDDSLNNSISIDNQNNNLGVGDYEFALSNDNNFRPYQEEPFFEYVEPGIHTIYIQDKNGCGITSINVAVIGYPKFLTPNNDGVNDRWQVQGINENFYATSVIYIFDRFGKVIANVDPTGDGWDGFYNGRKQPSADYWFKVQLMDKNGNTREKTGHFSLIRR